MTCSINITTVLNVSSASGGNNLIVQGTAAGCSGSVNVTVAGPGGASQILTPASIQDSGDWFTSLPGSTYPTTASLTITATCSNDPNCIDTWSNVPATGALADLDACPIFSFAGNISYSDCNPDGTRTVTLNATVELEPNGWCVLSWGFGDGSAPSSFSVANPSAIALSSTVTAIHNYQPGTYTATLGTAITSGPLANIKCPNASTVVTVLPCESSSSSSSSGSSSSSSSSHPSSSSSSSHHPSSSSSSSHPSSSSSSSHHPSSSSSSSHPSSSSSSSHHASSSSSSSHPSSSSSSSHHPSSSSSSAHSSSSSSSSSCAITICAVVAANSNIPPDNLGIVGEANGCTTVNFTVTYNGPPVSQIQGSAAVQSVQSGGIWYAVQPNSAHWAIGAALQVTASCADMSMSSCQGSLTTQLIAPSSS